MLMFYTAQYASTEIALAFSGWSTVLAFSVTIVRDSHTRQGCCQVRMVP